MNSLFSFQPQKQPLMANDELDDQYEEYEDEVEVDDDDEANVGSSSTLSRSRPGSSSTAKTDVASLHAPTDTPGSVS